MFQLILGRTGTGKTTEIFHQAMDAACQGHKVILLVPEQFSFEAEKRVYTTLSGEDALNLSVLSFSRLSENIFRAYGGLASKRLTDTARYVLMKLAVKEMKDTLSVYQKQSQRAAFLSTMLETVEELKQSGTYPETLGTLAAGLDDYQLAAKLRDIAGIYGAYQAIIDRSYADPLDDIAKAAKLAEENRYFSGLSVYIDGFSFFSPPQRRLLYAMLEQGEEVRLALCADGLSTPGNIDIFTDQKKTALKLVTYAKEHFVTVGAPVTLTHNRRTQNPALLTVEEIASGEWVEGEEVAPDGLRVISAANRYGEVQFAAAEISRLVREAGWRYRDFAVICRNLDDYQTTIRGVFESYGLPVFMNQKESILSKPIVAVVTAALDAVCGSYPTEAILKIIRSPAMGLPTQQAAAVENYVYVWSVRGEAWTQPFCNNPQGLRDEKPQAYAATLEPIEAARQGAMEPLSQLKKSLTSCDGKGFSLALYDFLIQIKALEHLKAYFEAENGENFSQGQENSRLWDCIVDILDLFSDNLEGVSYSAKEFAELFRLALSCVELGNIPAANDEIIAGSADKVRLASPRAVFVLGINEGVFPAKTKPYGVFTNRERSRLIAAGVEITSPELERVLLEQFYLYSALGAPGEQLYLSFALADLKGNPMEPALVLGRILKQFPGLQERGEDAPPEFFINDLETAKSCYAALLGEDSASRATVAQLLREEGEESYLCFMEGAVQDLPMGNIRSETAKRLLRDRISVSPTKIENYYQCPYRFFCEYLLKLRPRKKAEYSPLESGTAIHYVLEMLLKELGGRGIGSLEDGELMEKIRHYLTKYIEAVVSDPKQLAARLKYQFDRLVTVLFMILRHIGNDFDQSTFQAAGMEVTVGETGEVHPTPIAAEDGTQVVITGKIDRVDTFEDATGSYARVIDYKSGGKEFHVEDVLYGLNMQMLVYLFSLCDDEKEPFGPVKPAGILYMPGNVAAIKAAADVNQESIRGEVAKKLQMSGVVLDEENVLRAMERELEGRYIPVKLKKDESFTAASRVRSREEFEEIRKLVYQNIREMATALTQGQVAPLPAQSTRIKPCSYCDYGGLCNNRDGRVFRDVSGEKESGGEEENS